MGRPHHGFVTTGSLPYLQQVLRHTTFPTQKLTESGWKVRRPVAGNEEMHRDAERTGTIGIPGTCAQVQLVATSVHLLRGKIFKVDWQRV